MNPAENTGVPATPGTALQAANGRQATPGQTIGPFFGYALPFAHGGDMAPTGHPDTITIHGAVHDGAGQPVPDALLEFWQAGHDGSLTGNPGSLHRDGHTFTGFGRVPTGPDGHWVLRTLPPAVPAGAPHIAVAVFARGLLHRLFTRIYLPGNARANAADPLLRGLDPARRATLVAHAESDRVFRFDVRLQGDGETVFLEHR